MAPTPQKKGKKASPAKSDSVISKNQQQEQSQQSGQEETVMQDAEDAKAAQDSADPHQTSEAFVSAQVAGNGSNEGTIIRKDASVPAPSGAGQEEENAPTQKVEVHATAVEGDELVVVGIVEEVEEEENEDRGENGCKASMDDTAMRTADEEGERDEESENDNGDDTPTADEASRGPSGGDSEPSSGKIFIGGLSRGTTIEVLTRHFKKYGELTDSVIMKNRSTGQPRGFGFVTYADPSIVDRVLQDTHVIDGRTVDAKRTVPREKMPVPSKGPKTKKIFVGGLTSATTEDDLKAYFLKFGKISSCQIMQDHEARISRGFGFVTFENEQAVEDVLAQGKMHEICDKQVEIKKAEPKRADEPLPRAERGAYMGARRGAVGPGAYGSSSTLYGGYQSSDAYMFGGAAGGYFNRSTGRPGGLAYGDTYGYAGGYGAPYGYGEFNEGYGSMIPIGGYPSGSTYGYNYSAGGAYGGSSRSYGSGRYHPYR
ncbi:hypothetical protein KP509_36G044000 [Ceratopteris richardii]|uniref:RRM domain-containing protein n=1 Tax=Ceratopteris richardii TaxID=49495 RepID=A0A8T2QB90_CERRI|nr:hypothetical protein KP509_36G044000 [Ceratopteris richardii]KAH7281377.1 hypothetical protein KP509_36G044000 [Ceratopteris richardii]